MVKIYPVILEPLQSLNSGLEKITSTGERVFAIISDIRILIKEKTPKDLGNKYYENYKERLKISSIETDFFSNCPYKIINTAEGIFRVKELGSLHVKDFEKGMSEASHKYRKL